LKVTTIANRIKIVLGVLQDNRANHLGRCPKRKREPSDHPATEKSKRIDIVRQRHAEHQQRLTLDNTQNRECRYTN